MNRLLEIIRGSSTRLYDELVSKFAEIPASVCECGKPVVFVQGSREFKCTRCYRKYKLIVEVRQTGGQ